MSKGLSARIGEFTNKCNRFRRTRTYRHCKRAGVGAFYYTLRVAIFFAFLISLLYLLLRFALPALLPEIVDEVERQLRQEDGLYLDIESPELAWRGARPIIYTDHLDVSNIQNLSFRATNVEIDFSSLLSWVKGNPIRADVLADEIIIEPTVSQEDAASIVTVPIPRNPYDQLSGIARYAERLSVRSKTVRLAERNLAFDSAAIYLRLEEEIAYQFNADPLDTFVKSFNITGRLTPDTQRLSFDISPSEKASEWLSRFGLKPLTPLHLSFDSQNFFNQLTPEVSGLFFQGGKRFASMSLENERWTVQQETSGELAKGNFRLGANFNWELSGQLILASWLDYVQRLPAFNRWIKSLESSGSMDFVVSGSSPLLPNNSLYFAPNQVSLQTPLWSLTNLNGASVLTLGNSTQTIDLSAEAFEWDVGADTFGQPTKGRINQIELTGDADLAAEKINLDALEFAFDSQPPIVLTGTYDYQNAILTSSMTSDKINFAKVLPMLPIDKTDGFGRWLNTALVDSLFSNFAIDFAGPLSTFFTKQSSLVLKTDWQADTFKFNRRWDQVYDASASLRYENNAMDLSDIQGHYLDMDFQAATATLTQVIGSPMLSMDPQVNGPIKDILTFFEGSPLNEKVLQPLKKFELAGQAAIDADMLLSLKKDSGIPPDIRFVADLTDTSALIMGDRSLSNIDGQIAYDTSSKVVTARDVELEFMGTDSIADLTVDTAQQPAEVEATVHGNYEANSLFQDTALADMLSGRSDWQIDFTQTSADQTQLSLRSDLEGTTLMLPNELKTDSQADFRLNLTTQGDSAELTIDYPDVLDADLGLRRQQQGFKLINGVVHVGEGEYINAPPDEGISVSGQLPMLDIAELAGGNAELSIERADLQIDRIKLGQYVIPNGVRLVMDKTNKTVDFASNTIDYEISIDGENAIGLISYDSSRNHIWADFSKLAVIETGSVQESNLGMLSPEVIPSLDINVFHLVRDGHDFGSIKLSGRNEGVVYRVENAALNTGRGWIHGTATLENLKPFTRLQIETESAEIGAIVAVLTGYQNLDMQRLYANADFLMNQAAEKPLFESGQIAFRSGAGNFYGINPNMMAVLKTLNPLWLLRTAMGRQAPNGYAFQSIEGYLRLQPDYVAIDQVDLVSDIANLHIDGIINKENNGFGDIAIDVDVLPRVTGVSSIAGAALGGPIGALIGYTLGEAMMLNPNKASNVLRIRGTIDEPRTSLRF